VTQSDPAGGSTSARRFQLEVGGNGSLFRPDLGHQQLAEQTDDPVIKNELLELASVCEEVARNIDGSPDRR
jgi:hypothetical protein